MSDELYIVIGKESELPQPSSGTTFSRKIDGEWYRVEYPWYEHRDPEVCPECGDVGGHSGNCSEDE